MNLLLDTHVLLWSAQTPDRLRRSIQELLEDGANRKFFSVVSLWEIGVKQSLGRADFSFDPRRLRDGLLRSGLIELNLTAEHALAMGRLPQLHKDPFDRLLLCQALVDDLEIVSADRLLLQYPQKFHRA